MEDGVKAGFALRVGLASGPLATGSVGSAARRAFTVYGDTVNRAARLEALAKSLGERIVMDAATAVAAPTPRDLGDHLLRGTVGETRVFAPAS